MTSINNSIIKQIRLISVGKIKDKFIIEGKKWLNEIPSYIKINYFVVSESFYSKFLYLNEISKVYVVKNDVFKKIQTTITTQGIVAVCEKKLYNVNDIKINNNAFILMIDNVSDPGNMGTMLRSALAFGCNFVICSKGCVSVYNDKVLRATAGAIFRLAVIENANLNDMCLYLKEKGVKLIGTSSYSNNFHYDINFTSSICIIFGNEARGISHSVSQHCNELVKIPIIDIESLNVSVACGILLHEVLKQRLM